MCSTLLLATSSENITASQVFVKGCAPATGAGRGGGRWRVEELSGKGRGKGAGIKYFLSICYVSGTWHLLLPFIFNLTIKEMDVIYPYIADEESKQLGAGRMK